MEFLSGSDGDQPIDGVPAGEAAGEPVDRQQPQDGAQSRDGAQPPAERPEPGQAPDAEEFPVPVPEELHLLPPGALLAELLDEIPVESVSGFDSVVVLAAAYRQLCRQQAVFYQALVESGLRVPGSASTVARLSAPGEFAAEEARAKLVWSRQRSQREYVLGFDLFIRFPRLGEGLRAGEIDLPRARALIDWTDGLTEEQAGVIISQLLPVAADLVVGALIDEVKRAAIAIDGLGRAPLQGGGEDAAGSRVPESGRHGEPGWVRTAG
jgi:hypothetical protein